MKNVTVRALRKSLIVRSSILLFCSFFLLINSSWAQVDSMQSVNSDSTNLSLSLSPIFHELTATETIAGTDLQSLSVMPVGHALQGQATGIWSMQTSAQPGGVSSIWIRGYNSSMNNNQPLIILDGLPLYNNESFIEEAQIGPLSLLNPYDIASIEVIKDAGAARYGMRGFNGVLLINTKKGEGDKLSINFHTKLGFQQASKFLPLMNAEEYAYYVNEIFQERDSVVFSENQIRALGKGTNWQKEIFTTTPVWQNYLSVSGGTKNTQYYLSGSFLDQDGIVKNSGFKRQSVLGKLTHFITPKISVSPQINFSHSISMITPDDVIDNLLSFSPTVPVKDSVGNYGINGPVAYSFDANPMELVDRINKQYESSLTFGKISLAYEIIDSLYVRVNLSRNISKGEYNYLPEKDYERWSREYDYKHSTYLIEPTLSYHRSFTKHDVQALVGYAYQKEKSEINNTTYNLVEDRINSIYESRVTDVYTSPVWMNFSYSFDQRYALMLTGRYENYENWGSKNKVISPALAVAWHLHHEPFMQKWSDQTAYTLRASFGELKKIYPTYSTRSGWIINTEKNRQWNVGIDISLLNKQVYFSLDAYEKKLDNLFTTNLTSAGYAGTYINTMGVLNKGFEFSLNVNYGNENWAWKSKLGLSTNQNQVLKLPEDIRWRITTTGLPRISFVTIEREAVSSFYGYLTNGLFDNEDEVESSGQINARPGGLKYLDETVLGHAQPIWQSSLRQYVGYRRWSLEAFLYASVGNEILNYQKYYQQSGYSGRNQYKLMLNRWSPERPDSTIPAYLNTSELSTYVVENASFLRLRDITISYHLPLLYQAISAKLYMSAQNLFTLTSYQGYDPEVSYFGQNVNALGVDFDSYPRAKTFLLGCHISF